MERSFIYFYIKSAGKRIQGKKGRTTNINGNRTSQFLTRENITCDGERITGNGWMAIHTFRPVDEDRGVSWCCLMIGSAHEPTGDPDGMTLDRCEEISIWSHQSVVMMLRNAGDVMKSMLLTWNRWTRGCGWEILKIAIVGCRRRLYKDSIWWTKGCLNRWKYKSQYDDPNDFQDFEIRRRGKLPLGDHLHSYSILEQESCYSDSRIRTLVRM